MGSKFYAFAFPVTTEEDIATNIDALRKRFHDARHHCYAYILGLEDQHFKASDDGEPGHSAGDPILGQIRSFGLTNTLVVVVRYFGGTKLGIGGLTKAYKTAAQEALMGAKIREIWPTVAFNITYAYDQTNVVERLIGGKGIQISDREFAEACHITGNVRKDLSKALFSQFEDAGISMQLIDPSDDSHP